MAAPIRSPIIQPIFKQFPQFYNGQGWPKSEGIAQKMVTMMIVNKIMYFYYYYFARLYILLTKYQSDCTMLMNRSNLTFDVESEAKNTLAFFSDYQYEFNHNQWDYDARLNTGFKRKQYRLLDPIKNVKADKLDKNRTTNTQSFYRGRTALVPYKISLQNQQPATKGKVKTSSHSRNQYQTIAKQNYKPHKTIRNAYSLTRHAEERQEEQGFDFMQYWIRHRFEDGAITTLVEKLREKNTTVIRL